MDCDEAGKCRTISCFNQMNLVGFSKLRLGKGINFFYVFFFKRLKLLCGSLHFPTKNFDHLKKAFPLLQNLILSSRQMPPLFEKNLVFKN